MILALSLLFLGVGIALIMNSFMRPVAPGQEMLRYDTPSIRGRRLWPAALGVIVALGGIAILLLL